MSDEEGREKHPSLARPGLLVGRQFYCSAVCYGYADCCTCTRIGPWQPGQPAGRPAGSIDCLSACVRRSVA